MPYHIAAYRGTLNAGASNEDIAAVTDEIIAVQNGHLLPQRDLDIIFAYAQSATLNRARIVSPTNRQVTLPFIRPITNGTTPANDPNFADYRGNPFRVRGLEELAIEATTDLAMGSETAIVVLGLQGQFQPAPPGDIFTMRGTSTSAATANVWTTLATVTWADILPAGTYACVGVEVVGAACIATRLIFENQTERPGALGNVLIGSRVGWPFMKGGFGLLGYFTSTRMPLVQVLATAATASWAVYLDIIRVR